MMLGECMCMAVYLILKYVVYKDNPEKVDGDDPKPMNPLVLWPVRRSMSFLLSTFKP
jgi:hypothetical protein